MLLIVGAAQPCREEQRQRRVGVGVDFTFVPQSLSAAENKVIRWVRRKKKQEGEDG